MHTEVKHISSFKPTDWHPQTCTQTSSYKSKN